MIEENVLEAIISTNLKPAALPTPFSWDAFAADDKLRSALLHQREVLFASNRLYQ